MVGNIGNLEVIGFLAAGLVLGLGGIGSALGVGTAGQTAAGAWAAEGKAGKPLNVAYLIMTAAPLSQTLYAWIMMGRMLEDKIKCTPQNSMLLLGIGIGVGLCELFSAWLQGKIGAAAIRCMHESGQGFGFLIAALGLVETVGIFGMIFGFQVTDFTLKLSGAAG